VTNHPGYITNDSERWPALHNLGAIDQEGQHCKGCGAAHWFEERTQADRKKGKHRPVSFYRCCNYNTIRLPPVSDPFPPELQALFTGEGHTFGGAPVTPALMKAFCDNTRAINNKLAFACVTNTNQDTAINISRPGHSVPWVYRIHGQMYRQIAPPIARREGITAQYSQLYFNDPNESLETYRQAFENNAILQSIVQHTHLWIRAHNPYAQTYRTLREVLDMAREDGQEMPIYSIVFNQHKDLDIRTYNVPTAAVNEVAAILIGERSKHDRERTLTVTHRFVEGYENFAEVKCTCPESDALCYTLLKPFGDPGYAYGMETWDGPEPLPELPRQPGRRGNTSFVDDEASNSDSESQPTSSEDEGEFGQAQPNRRKKKTKWEKKKKMSMLDFFAYRMHWRKAGVHPNNKFDPMFYARRLFQQYAVDAFSRVEENELNYLRSKDGQKKLRSEAYSRLSEYVNAQADERGMRPGKPIVLPSTFAGSSRHMSQEYQDAMSIVRKTGHNGLDLFLTITANSNWEEVISSLPRNEHGTLLHQPADRPDIVARVFKLKLDALLEDLFEHKIFGEVAGYAWTIEYQVQESFANHCLEKSTATTLATSHLSFARRGRVTCHSLSEGGGGVNHLPPPPTSPPLPSPLLTDQRLFFVEARTATCAYPADPKTHHRQTEDR
jgi:hypothetical protein